jgi:hypothetical protein
MAVMGEGVGDGKPRWPPGMVINDYTTGYFAALAVQSITLERLRGVPGADGPWLVSPSLTGTAMAIVKYFKSKRWTECCPEQGSEEPLPPETIEAQTGLGYLKTLKPLPKMSGTPIQYEYELLVPMGSSIPCFPGFEDDYDVRGREPMLKEDVLHIVGRPALVRMEQLRRAGIEFRRMAATEGETEKAKI